MKAWCLALVLLVLLGWRLALGVSPSTQLADLLPANMAGQSAGDSAAFATLKARFDNQLWLVVENADPKALVSDANMLAKALSQADFLKSWQGGPDSRFERYGEYRAQLMAKSDRQLSDEALVNRALGLWFGPTPSSLRADPLLTFSHWLDSQKPATTPLALQEGWPLWHKDGRYAVILTLSLKGSAYDGALQAKVSSWLAALPVKVQAVGTLLYAQQGANQAQREVSRFGTLALAAVLALIAWGFGGWRALGFMGALLTLSLLGALTALWWCFPHAHWLALVMGASVIGICADYGFHALAAGAAQRSIRGPLLGGLVSSLVAYGVLVLSPFPGLSQLGVTALGGLLIAYGYVRYAATVPLAPSRQWPARFMAAVDKRQGVARWLLLAVIALWCALGAGRLSFDDDIRQWQPKDAALEKVASRLEYWLGQRPGGQYLLLRAADTQGLLEQEEALMPRLDALKAKGQLGSVLALSQGFPSLKRQHSDHLRLSALWQQLDSRLGGALGPVPAFMPGLTPANWPKGDGRLQLLLEGTNPATVMVLQGLTQEGAAALGDLGLIDPTARITHTFGHYRDQVLWLLLLAFGILALVLLAALRAKGVRVLFATALALGAAAVTPAYLGQPFNLIHALGLILVLGLSLDYCLFFVSGKVSSSHTLLAVLLSMLSSLFAFGLLVASSTPVLAGFGALVAVGLLCAWLSSLLWARSL
ncbi:MULTISPECIES: hypothetical protein [Gammaproteobacteria]|uniref:hypothetical protein n=1 Tax=Gammaproteobacteria TaxID=1236 RepID=UPI003A8CAC90